jgi:hypothetical protein
LGQTWRTGEPEMAIEKWKRQFIRLLFHYSRKRSSFRDADSVKAPHVPSALYKYRRFCDEHKKALERGVLRRSSPSQFNDPYDSTIYFDVGRFVMEDLSFAEFTNAVAAGTAVGFEPKRINKPIYQRDWRQKFMKDLLQNQPREVADACFKQAAERITRLQDETVQFMTDTVRQGYSVVCFAETAASVLMWSHYADDHKGFCVEYNLTGELARLCCPVLYRKKMTDVTRFMFKKDPTDMNNLFPMYASLLKSDEWSY